MIYKRQDVNIKRGLIGLNNMHSSRNPSGSNRTCEHEFLVPDTERNTMDNAHRIDIPPSLNSAASKGKQYTIVTLNQISWVETFYQ